MKYKQKRLMAIQLTAAFVITFLLLFFISGEYSKMYAGGGDCCAQCTDYCECAAECSGSCIKTKQCGWGLPDCRGEGTNCCVCDESLPI